MTTSIFPKMEHQFDLHDILFSEDYLHLQRTFDEAQFLPTNSLSWDIEDFKFDVPKIQYPTPFSSYNNDQPQNLENLGADFHLWNECPPLSDDAWQAMSHLPPLSYINENPNPISFKNNNDNFMHNNPNDQSLDVVVLEGLSMRRNKMEEKSFVNEVDNNKSDNNEGLRINKEKAKIDTINYEEIRKYFDMPISKAAKELNVGLTVLKKKCRELKIKRWPHRKIKSLNALICNVKELGRMDMVEALENCKRSLHFAPELELTEETKKLRQACFKANYKKRRALALSY